ncbi:MAG: hypothetical protein ETSY1_03685 [Candidatus Entotheonella factor]|uniref:DUF1318 domain-containing protein n=1 Tax=Entotheonella factor TaxID=1429438 RepID=W4LXD9_ENTF1|nr:DUF1318 domain-containing protein [Candidatus Entotheonella palauensis]ETX02406.1 MAG: hypothetical protein ETSY1_03685 [Candidatus Entotheonella factor]
MHRLKTFILVFIITFSTATCARITVNVYFPAAEIQDAATQIEQEVRSGDESEPPAADPPDATKPRGSLLWPSIRTVRMAFTPPSAIAQAPNINITTPAIRRLIASRKKRYGSLVPLLNRCVLGETNRGLLDIRSLQGLSLKDKAQAKALRDQENRDRQQLYRELATANKLPANRLGEIASIFAKVNRRDARSGWCIQDASGSWKKK